MDLPRRQEGESDQGYGARLEQLPVLPGWEAWFQNIVVPRFHAWAAGPNNASTQDQRTDLTPAEEEKLAQMRDALKKAQKAYDQVVTTKGVAYWRSLRSGGPEEADKQFRAEAQARGLTAVEVEAEIQRNRENASKVQSAIVTTASTAATGVAAATGASLAALGTTAAAASAVPIAGWIISAAIALSIALSQLILRLVGTPERTPAQWKEWQLRVQKQVQDHLGHRQEGIDTYRGFTADGVELEEDPLLALEQVVNRRLFVLSLTSGVDMLTLFPVLPFGTVVETPYLLDAIPEINEMEAVAYEQQRVEAERQAHADRAAIDAARVMVRAYHDGYYGRDLQVFIDQAQGRLDVTPAWIEDVTTLAEQGAADRAAGAPDRYAGQRGLGETADPAAPAGKPRRPPARGRQRSRDPGPGFLQNHGIVSDDQQASASAYRHGYEVGAGRATAGVVAYPAGPLRDAYARGVQQARADQAAGTLKAAQGTERAPRKRPSGRWLLVGAVFAYLFLHARKGAPS